MEIDLNKVLDAVSKTIHEAFPSSQRFLDSVEQGLRKRDFVLNVVSADHDPLISGRIHQRLALSVIYFPEGKSDECLDVYEALRDVLTLLTLDTGGKLRAESIRSEMQDDTMIVILRYSYNTLPMAAETPMDSLLIKEER